MWLVSFLQSITSRNLQYNFYIQNLKLLRVPIQHRALFAALFSQNISIISRVVQKWHKDEITSVDGAGVKISRALFAHVNPM